MPSISYSQAKPHQAERPRAYTLELRPPIADRAAELVCRHTVEPALMVVNNSSNDHTRLRAEASASFDMNEVARRVGTQAYPGQSVEVIPL